MKFEIEWRTKENNKDSYYWCNGCGRLTSDAFKIIKKYHGDLTFCLECMQDLQSTILPLSILVLTGKDTKRGEVDG